MHNKLDPSSQIITAIFILSKKLMTRFDKILICDIII